MASIDELSHGGFRVRWREGKKARSKSFKPLQGDVSGARRRAEDFKEMVERRAEEGAPVFTRSDMPTVQSFMLELLAIKESELERSTMVRYLSILNSNVFPEIGHLNLRDCRPLRMEEWLRRRIAAGAGPESLRAAMSLLGQMFRRAVRLELIPGNPMDGMRPPPKKPRPHRWFSVGEVETLRSYLLDGEDPLLGDAALISVLAYVGVRPQDALALEVDHILADRKRLKVVQKNVDGSIRVGSKTGLAHRRLCYLPEPVLVDLENWLAIREVKSVYIFPRPDGKPWTTIDYKNWHRRTYKPAAEAAGLGVTKPYDLRHTAATLYLASGFTPAGVANQLGHSILTSMSVYQHLLEIEEFEERKSVDERIIEARFGADRVQSVSQTEV